MGVPYVNAPEEADSQCAWLAKNGYVDAVFNGRYGHINIWFAIY